MSNLTGLNNSVQLVDQSTTSSAAGWLNQTASSLIAGSFLAFRQTDNGQNILELCQSPLSVGKSTVTFNTQLYGDYKSGWFDFSLSQRIRHILPYLEVFGGTQGASFSDIAVSPAAGAIYQCSVGDGSAYNASAGTLLTIVLATALPGGVYIGDWIHVYNTSASGLVDNRLCYPSGTLRFISKDRLTICIGFSDENALPSLAAQYTVGANTTYVRVQDNDNYYPEVASYRFTNTSATAAAMFTSTGGADEAMSGTLLGAQTATTGSTAAVYTNGNIGHYEIKPTSRFGFELAPNDLRFMDVPIDTAGSGTTIRAARTTVLAQGALQPRLRFVNPISMTRPVAKVVSATKAGTTTTTVTMDVTPTSAGIYVNSYVTLRNVRDQVNWANSATAAQVTAVNDGAKTITLVWGVSATATSYGGSVVLQFGQVDQQGISAIIANSAAYDSVADRVTLVGSGTWAGYGGVGEYVELHGIRDNTSGADLGIDGVWMVESVATTTMTLIPVLDINGSRQSPALSTFTTTNCGGGLILRTTMRLHRMVLTQRQDSVVRIDGQGTSDLVRALPVQVISGSIGTVSTVTTVTTVTTVSTVTSVTAVAALTGIGAGGFDVKQTLGQAMEDLAWADAIRRNIT